MLVARDSESSRARHKRLRFAGLRFERKDDAPVDLAPAVMNRMIREPEALRACAIILVTVKRNGNAWVGATLRDHAAADAAVACAQNGCGQAEEILALAKPWAGAVVDGMIAVAVNYHDNEPRATPGGPLADRAGRDWAAPPRCATYGSRATEALKLDGAVARAAGIAEIVAGAGFPCAAVDDVGAVQRTKMVLNQNNAVSALLGCSVTEAIRCPASRRIIGASMLEAKAVFEAQGFALNAEMLGPVKLLTLPDFIFDCLFPFVAHKLPADEFESSMNQDLAESGRGTEIAYLNGMVERAGAEAGVETPMTTRVLRVVEAMERGERPRTPLTPDQARAEFLA